MARFLVVDDDPASVKGIALLLIDDGHEVVQFTAGADAVEALSRETFDAIVTDLEMPYVDGYEVMRAAREHNPRACLVVASACAPEQCQSLVDAGACVVADKPFAYDEVAKAISDCRAQGGPDGHGRCAVRSRPSGEQLVAQARK
jgi:CheY-like chemotaxis protein